MKKGLVVVLLVVGLGILFLAVVVVVRGLNQPPQTDLASTEGGSTTELGGQPQDYSSIFEVNTDGSEAEGSATDTNEIDASNWSEESADSSESSDSSDGAMAAANDGPVDNTQFFREEATPTPRKKRRWVARNSNPVGHKKFARNTSSSSSTVSSSSSFNDTSFDDSSSSSFNDTSFDDSSSSSGGFDDSFDTGSSSTDTSSSFDDGFDDSFDDSALTSSSDDPFGDTSSASSDSGGFDDPFGDTGSDDSSTGGDEFGDFFDGAGGDDGGAMEDPFAATGGGGGAQEFTVSGSGTAVRKVSHSRANGLTEIRIELSGSTLPQYRVFPLRARGDRPARVWVDFENTGLGSGPPLAGDGALIKKIRLVKKSGASAQVARVQIELTGSKPPPVDWREENGALVVVLGGANRLGGGREFPRRD